MKLNKIAITAHLFYADYSDIIIELLSNITYEYDLFITSSSNEILNNFLHQISKQHYKKYINKIYKIVSLNRGRNFGPLLVEFGTILKKYDIIAHIHTKKSLHHGRPRYDWGMHCISSILNSNDNINYIIKTLSEDNEYGIVCPTRYEPAVPWYGHHWLQNFSIGSHIAQKISVNIENTFLNYPIGGMFWARKEVMNPILSYKWSYEDFPIETGQIDGTTHHAIERLIGASCTDLKFKILQYNSQTSQFDDSKNPAIDYFKTISKEYVLNQIAISDTISFDIFDTLMYRNVFHPNDIRDLIKFKNYKELRMLSENNVRSLNNFSKDATMPDIAAEFSKLTSISINEAVNLLNTDFNIDILSLNRRDPVIDFVEYAKKLNKRIIYVSDTYYSYDQINIILNKLLIYHPNKLYLSSEIGFRKDQKKLWEYVKNEEINKNILHFGDNIVSDIQISSEFNIKSIYIPSVYEKIKMLNILLRDPQKKEWSSVFPLVEKFGKEPFFC